jgi:hypothetical protein
MNLPVPKLVASAAGLVALVVVALVIFGSSSNNSVDPIAAAATRSASAPGFRMLLSMKIGSSALPNAVTGEGSGSFNTHGRSGSMTLLMRVAKGAQSSETIRLNEILDGTTIYMQLPSSLMGALGTAGKKWISIDLAKVTGVAGLSSIESNPASTDPGEMLQYLKAASGSVTNEGNQVVDGFQTTAYHADLEISKIPDAVPAAERAAAQRAMSKLQQVAHISEMPVTVWIDRQHLVRRMTVTVAASAQGQTINEAITIDIPEYGPQAPPAIPPSSEVASANGLAGAGA